MKLEYIKANGEYYYPMQPGIQDPSKIDGVCYEEVRITKLWFGRYKVEMFPYVFLSKDGTYKPKNNPHTTIILYPAGIQEIKYSELWHHQN